MRLLALRLARTPTALLGLAVVLAVVLFSVLVPVLWPHDPDLVLLANQNRPPGVGHPLGTDFFGRDLFARLAEGGRFSLGISGAALGLVLGFGFLYGSSAALLPRRLDMALMRVADGLLAVPRLPIVVIVLVAAGLNTNALTVVIAISLGGWMIPARLVRNELVSLRQRRFVVAAHAMGVRPLRLLGRHLLPNAVGVLLVAAFLELPTLVLSEAFESALGVGINPPTATWGNLALDGIDHHRVWVVFLPSVAIALFAVGANFVADGVQEALGPGAAAGGRGRVRAGLESMFRSLFAGRSRAQDANVSR
jgi:ABC-type dipeptide/oligopeptide/nickel transport system permease subunit